MKNAINYHKAPKCHIELEITQLFNQLSPASPRHPIQVNDSS